MVGDVWNFFINFTDGKTLACEGRHHIFWGVNGGCKFAVKQMQAWTLGSEEVEDQPR